MKEVAIVYLVAGISSRFGGKIKQFAVVGSNGETLIEYSMNQAIKAGFNKIIFIVGNSTEKPFKEKFKDSYKGIEIKYAHQLYDPKERDKPWGTCDAICSAKNLINGAFVVCNGDDIYGEKPFRTPLRAPSRL
jgi:dTDP-glucose pyrophosphorylase